MLEIIGERGKLGFQRDKLIGGQYPDMMQPFRVCTAGLDIMQKKLPVQQYVISGQKALNFQINGDAGFLP